MREDASKVFANTDIKGGVAITYRTSDAKYEPIVVFTKYPALNHILHKVNNTIDFVPMDTLVVTRTAYRLTEKLHQEHTEAMDQLSKGHPYDMSTNIFDRLPQFFLMKHLMTVINIFEFWEEKILKEYISIFVPIMLISLKICFSIRFFTKRKMEMVFWRNAYCTCIRYSGNRIHGNIYQCGCFDSKAEATNLLKYIKVSLPELC